MSEVMKISLTAFFGVVVFVVGQLIARLIIEPFARLIIEPLEEQRRIIGRIAHAVTFYRGIAIDAKGDKYSLKRIAAIRSSLRGLAADLRASLKTIPCYRLFAVVRLALPATTAQQVVYQLMRWELFMSERAATGAVTEIAKLLRLDYIEDEWIEYHRILGLTPPKPEMQGDGLSEPE